MMKRGDTDEYTSRSVSVTFKGPEHFLCEILKESVTGTQNISKIISLATLYNLYAVLARICSISKAHIQYYSL